MRYLLIFLLFITSISFGQLSNKHWIPPIHARDVNVVEDHYLYLSTPNPTPFEVNVTYGDGTIVTGSPFTISQGNPQTIEIGFGQPSPMFMSLQNVNVVTNIGGLILTGTEDFYATFKVRAQNHAEILVSKGIPGIGTNFRLGSLPQVATGGARNFVSSFMATQDNTTVTVSDYDTGVVFASGSGDVTLDSQTFILNKGQSVVLSGYSDNGPNLAGFVGALLTSDKPIAVNTGNALAGMTNPSPGGQDYNLDQIVSVENVGSEYLVVKGNGSNNTELPLVIATEDNTDVFVNGSATPIINLNAGDYYTIPTSNYQGVNNNQNMYITSSKPIYLYQILAGSSSDATTGLNFIPPLSCFFQKSVDLIPSINTIGNINYSADIIALTYADAIISVNGNPTTAQPQNVLGTNQWVTYRISGFSGNVVVESTGPLAVGIFGASGVAGFSGYYSGFGSEPRDTDVVLCSSGITNLLEEINGNPEPNGTWTPPLASGTDFFDPNIDLPGIYNYSYIGDCDIIDVDITVTIQQAPFAGTDTSLTVCNNDAPIDLFPLLGTGATAGGTWNPALASGTNIYNPSVDLGGNYNYVIPADDVCEEITATIAITNNPLPEIIPITDLQICDDDLDNDDTNGFATFDLSIKTSEILNNQPNISVTYHINQSDADNNLNPQSNYYSNSQLVYVRLTNDATGCYNTTSFNLIVNPLPVINSVVDLKQCDSNTDAITDFNLTEVNAALSTQNNLTFTFFTSQINAENNSNPIINDTDYNSANNSIVWCRVENENGCFRIAQVNLIVSTTTIPSNYSYTIEECDEYISSTDPENDGFDYFDFSDATSDILSLFPATQNLIVTYYTNENDALAEQNAITNITDFRNTIPNNQAIWVRLDSNLNNDCVGLGPYLKLKVNPLPVINLGADFILCLDPITGNGSQTINATPTVAGNYTYTWTPANPSLNGLGEQNAQYNVTQSGTYNVIVKNNTTGCENTESISVTTSSEPENFSALLITPLFASGLASIEALPTGGFGTYEYSIDGGNEWQSSPVFSGLTNGSYTILVRDEAQCGILESQIIQTVTYPAFFTPNGDGFNDVWNIDGLLQSYQSKIYIFDRYGKLITEIKPNSFGWDGTFNNQDLPASDYWFKIEFTQDNVRKEFKSHFSLVR
jgi:gliding motility-associated-like protein